MNYRVNIQMSHLNQDSNQCRPVRTSQQVKTLQLEIYRIIPKGIKCLTVRGEQQETK